MSRSAGRTGNPCAQPKSPLAGRIAAGSPVEAIEGQDTLHFADFAGKGDTFALQVSGESMIEDHIMSGDYVLVERTQQANDGEIVAALVGGRETTLKRLFHEPDAAVSACNRRIHPCNQSSSMRRKSKSKAAFWPCCGSTDNVLDTLQSWRRKTLLLDNILFTSKMSRRFCYGGFFEWDRCRSSGMAWLISNRHECTSAVC